MPSLEVAPTKSNLMIAAGAVAVLIAIALVTTFTVRKLTSDGPELSADADSYVDVGCSIAAALEKVSPEDLADGADSPHTTDAHAAAALLVAAGRRDHDLAGFATLGERLDLAATRNESGGMLSGVRAVDGRCGKRERMEVTDELRAAQSCVIRAHLEHEAGDVDEVVSESGAPAWELRGMALLASRAGEAPYDTTAEPADAALQAAGDQDDEAYAAALADLADACDDADL